MSAPLDYATPAPRRPWRWPDRGTLVAVGTCGVLTVGTFAVGWLSGSQEPYFGPIHESEAIVQVGSGSVLIAGWLAWAVAIGWRAVRNRRCRLLAALILLWPAVNVSCLTHGVHGYLDDLIRFQADPDGPAVTSPTPAPTR